MKFFILLATIITSLCYSQEIQFNQLISNNNEFYGTPQNSCETQWVKEHLYNLNYENESKEEINLLMPAGILAQANTMNYNSSKSSYYIETFVVTIVYLEGYNFHVADYFDGTRVVTCLDGGMRGVQGVAVNGIRTGESSNVEWHKNYFVHKYPNGKIYTYSNKQVIELK